MSKQVAILGSTGSIGRQTLEVIKASNGTLSPFLLTAHTSVEMLIAQAREHMPWGVCLTGSGDHELLATQLNDTQVKIIHVEELESCLALPQIDVVLCAMVGFAGLLPTLAAIKASKRIAIANKETLVVAGELVTSLALKHNATLLPVDSEHCAIYQCLVGEDTKSVDKLILTASGGPFLGYSKERLMHVSLGQALKHPKWKMGAKITIDSATLMNKGLEVIEAHWLFNIPVDQIEVLIHPQSVIHSMVEMCDGSIKAQLGTADMRLPIGYALHYPERSYNAWPKFDFLTSGPLTFSEPDINAFPLLSLAYAALEEGGNVPCTLNAANEVAVAAFLQERIKFHQISGVVQSVLERGPFSEQPTLDDLLETDQEARRLAHIAILQL